jgi:iron complex outermembrane recepter protein
MAKFQLNSARRFAHSASRFALGTAMVAAFAAPAFAQDAAPAEEEEDAIVVSGFRASLENAVNEKKNNDQIVESVSAEDIGKLPDASIGESIARLPGVTSQRLNGRSNNISIRGFGPDFSQTVLNGREQTSTGDSRAVEFDQYPSEIVSQVVVYKSPTASLVGQGLVGTIDIRTVRPLDYGKQVLAIGASRHLCRSRSAECGFEEIWLPRQRDLYRPVCRRHDRYRIVGFLCRRTLPASGI